MSPKILCWDASLREGQSRSQLDVHPGIPREIADTAFRRGRRSLLRRPEKEPQSRGAETDDRERLVAGTVPCGGIRAVWVSERGIRAVWSGPPGPATRSQCDNTSLWPKSGTGARRMAKTGRSSLISRLGLCFVRSSVHLANELSQCAF